MFPSLSTPGNVAETKFASREAKIFPNKFRNIFVAETMFPSLPTCSNTKGMGKNKYGKKMMLHHAIYCEQYFKSVHPNIFLEQCFLVCPHWKTWKSNMESNGREQCFCNNVS
jgi:hypothetical protein